MCVTEQVTSEDLIHIDDTVNCLCLLSPVTPTTTSDVMIRHEKSRNLND